MVIKKLDKSIDLDQVIGFKTDEKRLKDMFSTHAETIANALKEDWIIKYDTKKKMNTENHKVTTSTQFRQFYDKVIELNEKADRIVPDEFDIKILPFVKMLRSKVAYSHARGHTGKNFKAFMDVSIAKVDSQETLQNFKYFLEAIIGYMK